MAVLRRAFHLEGVLTRKHFDNMRKLLIVFTLTWLYFMIAEYLTTFYGQEVDEMRVFWQKFTGAYAIPFWFLFVTCFLIPMGIFLTRGKRSIGWLVAAGASINIGMWVERYIVVIPTLTRPRLLNELTMGTYRPTWSEWGITIACFAGVLFLYALFTRFFPIIPIWERSEEVEAMVHEYEHQQEEAAARDEILV
jgi:molybdopterin-containing oxidoreductase family membrane subunit